MFGYCESYLNVKFEFPRVSVSDAAPAPASAECCISTTGCRQFMFSAIVLMTFASLLECIFKQADSWKSLFLPRFRELKSNAAVWHGECVNDLLSAGRYC